MIRIKSIFLVLVFLLTPAMVLAESSLLTEKENIYVMVKDMQGDTLEGYLLLYPQEVTVSTKEYKEKSIPMSIIESIKVEKLQAGLPELDKLGRESYYSVRLQNSQEILTLQEKYTFSLNTSVGVVTKNLDPEAVKHSSQKDSTLEDSIPGNPSESNESFFRDQSVILSLEVRF
jgi:hypothetical protein